MQFWCAWITGKKSRTGKRSPATKLHNQNSLASTCSLTLRAAVSCCLPNEIPPAGAAFPSRERGDEDLLGKGECKVGWRLLGPAAYYSCTKRLGALRHRNSTFPAGRLTATCGEQSSIKKKLHLLTVSIMKLVKPVSSRDTRIGKSRRRNLIL